LCLSLNGLSFFLIQMKLFSKTAIRQGIRRPWTNVALEISTPFSCLDLLWSNCPLLLVCPVHVECRYCAHFN
jgi:hypothetical protein